MEMLLTCVLLVDVVEKWKKTVNIEVIEAHWRRTSVYLLYLFQCMQEYSFFTLMTQE